MMSLSDLRLLTWAAGLSLTFSSSQADSEVGRAEHQTLFLFKANVDHLSRKPGHSIAKLIPARQTCERSWLSFLVAKSFSYLF